ncbi:putative cardiolipin synthase [Litoreibacter halocynthiae]|uniref:Phospholipase D n=1 Tax=Litoreibacter halocynthiae TaxID=1242689 RepID=A0A4R7LSC9_9RHOB|nr:phospholipase D family protein [Litoreibacter halocynthiae]TDT77966.1 putative cardiolipin synthase [Litoreibacter halocynthiae]
MLLTLLRYLVYTVVFLASAILVARLIFPAPSNTDRNETSALGPAESGPLTEALTQSSARHKGLTGIAPLQNGLDAFAARILLANAAVSSIDVQYYIWRGDMTGHLLLKALYRAAERGVRVRLLLDDNGIEGLDDILVALDAHPNIEFRLYNPFTLRRFKRLSYAFDFFRLNHRMHNKAFTVDGRASILGGRNVGDEYFGTGTTPLQVDLDVLAVGDIVPQISADYDRYWNSKPVHPATQILGEPSAGVSIAAALAAFDNEPEYEKYRALLETSDIVGSLARGELALEWTNAVLVSDDPVLGFGDVPHSDLFVTRLLEAVGPIKSRFDGVTPYFVPGAQGVRAFIALEDNGISVRMLTNSLEATDALPVHAGYAKRREDLLSGGIDLFELRARAASSSSNDILGPLGSSGSNLHAKTFAVDGTRIFVGSFNFDPRSATLNTEMGLLIESTTMAEALHDAFDEGLSGLAWRVELRDRRLIWASSSDGTETSREPGSTLIKRLALTVIGWLPVEWLL